MSSCSTLHSFLRNPSGVASLVMCKKEVPKVKTQLIPVNLLEELGGKSPSFQLKKEGDFA